MRQKFGLRKAFVMEIVPDNSKVAVADTVLQEYSSSTGPASYGAAETSNLGAQPPSSSLEPHAATPASSSQFYPPGSSYTADNMSLALAESSTAPVNFFSSLPVSSVNSCTSPADAQAATSMYPDSPCFGYVNPVYFTSHSVTAAGSSAFSGPFADASTAFQRCTTSFGPMQPDIHPVYANSAFTSSESEPAISAAESPSQFAAQPLGTTAEVSPSLRAVAGYCQGAASVSALTSAVNENPSLLVVAEGDDDPTSLRVIDDTDDPTILRVADDLEDLSAGRTDVPLHSAEFSRTVVERRSQKCLTAEELPPLRISAGKISETEYQLPNVSGTYSLAYSGIERTSSLPSSLPSASPPSGTSTIVSPFIVELARGFPSPSLSSLIVSKKEPYSSPLLVPKLEALGTSSSGFAASYSYFSVLMVPSSLDPNYCSPSGCADLSLNASSSEPSIPSSPSSSGPLSDPAYEMSPDCPESRDPSSSPEAKPFSVSSLDPLSSDCMAASTSEAPSTCSHSFAALYSNSVTSSPCDSGNGPQSREPMDCTPSLHERVQNSTVDLEKSSPDSSHKYGENKVNYGPPPLPEAEVVPRGCIGKGHLGTGWPYAPQGWPNRDDKWPWRVGRRGCSKGFYKDRFLGLPISLVKGKQLVEFASKKAIVVYLKQNFPHLDVHSFFKAFQWRIPCVIHRSSCPAEASTVRGEKRQREADVDEHTENPAKRSRKECRAGNLKCGMETGRSVLLGPVPALDCDICCVEPGFCRECTCILCCQTIVPDGGDCNLVRCLQRPSAGGICGHGAHLECALKSQMAGVVKERGLDMEYLCRRCDRKTDLRELVTRLLEAVGNTLYRSVAEKSLQLALQVMQGTEHGGDGARVLESLVQAALRKVQSGVDIQDVFNDLRDQGMAAEAAKQQCLGRASSNGEDVPQQPEASLDQWLPSSGSPSSHPSPGTPSSFSSPIIRRNSSVNSPADGTEGAETGDQTGVDGHADESGEAVKVPLRKISSPGIEPSNIKSSQIRVSSRRDRAGSSSSDINQEGTYDSQAMARNGKFDAHEPGSRSLNLRTRSDHRGPTVGAGVHKDEHCKSCGAKRPSTHGLEVTSTLKFLMGEDGGLKSHRLSPARKGEFTAQNRARHTYDTDKEADHGVTGSPGTFSAAVLSSEDRASRKVLGISLRLLDDKCQQQVQSVLQKLRQVQQAEFLRAQERLMAQKDHILKQYELLEISRNEFDAAEISSSHHIIDFDRLMLKLSNQLAKASEERQTFDKMLKVAEGFSALSKDDLRKHYGWPPAREVESHD